MYWRCQRLKFAISCQSSVIVSASQAVVWPGCPVTISGFVQHSFCVKHCVRPIRALMNLVKSFPLVSLSSGVLSAVRKAAACSYTLKTRRRGGRRMDIE